MVYLKLAYLAELAVAFNLAFGEFKQEKISTELDERFNELNLGHGSALSQLTFSAGSKQIASHENDLMNVSQSWLAKSISRFDFFRRTRKNKQNTSSIDPLRMFFSRILLFATDPSCCNKKQFSIWGVPVIVMLSLPKGMLASWTYTKTKSWGYSPCSNSIFLWTLAVVGSLFILSWPEESIGATWWIVSKQIGMSPSIPPFFFILFGIVAGIFSLRPISAAAALFIGRYPPSPRGRYYSITMVFLVTSILALLTYCELSEQHFDDILVSRVFSFLFGFLVYATILPFLLFAGHLVLETAVTNWTAWAEVAAKKAVDGAINNLASLQADLVPSPLADVPVPSVHSASS